MKILDCTLRDGGYYTNWDFDDKLVNDYLKLIRFPHEIFLLDFDKIEKLDGWGKLSSSNLKYAINKSKNISLEKLIYALGIRHIGQENAKLISQNIKSLENLSKIRSNYNFNSFLNIDGIGETQVQSLKKFFSNKDNIKVINELKKFIKIEKEEKQISGRLQNQTFLITGKLNGISRAEVKSIIEKNSGKILSSVNNKLKYLVVGEKPTTKKINLAKSLKINIINQKELELLLN